MAPIPASHCPFSPYKYLLPCHLFFHSHHHFLCLRGSQGKQVRALCRSSSCCRPSRDSRQAGSEGQYMMSRGSKGGRGGELDLKLHLSPPAAPARGTDGAAAAASLSSDEEWSSSPSSCLSSEGEREPAQRRHTHGLQWSDSPEATSMVLAACPRCLMYVMLSEADPRCPRCRSPVLLDFLHPAARNSSVNISRQEDGDHSRGGGGARNRRA